MAEWSFLRRCLFPYTFQADLEDRPYHRAKSSTTYRVYIPIRQLNVYILLSGKHLATTILPRGFFDIGWLTWMKANFYLTFYFIAGSLVDPKLDPFGHNIGSYIFTILRFTCILLICTQFILSMGNRPQGYVYHIFPSRIV